MRYGFTAKRYRIEDGNVVWILSSVLKGCVAQDKDLSVAIKELEINEKEWLETAKLYKIPIPDELG